MAVSGGVETLVEGLTQKRGEKGKVCGKAEEDGETVAGYVGCRWYVRGVAYYTVNTVHIGMRAAGEEIITSPFCPLRLHLFSLWTNVYV